MTRPAPGSSSEERSSCPNRLPSPISVAQLVPSPLDEEALMATRVHLSSPHILKRLAILSGDWTRARYVVPGSIAATLLMGVGDYVTGVDTTFTLLYMFPLALGTWLRGRTLGIVLAFLATICATVTALVMSFMPLRLVPLRLAPFVWNQMASLTTMLFVVWILMALRAYVEREQKERQIAVEHLRHADRLNVIGKLASGVAHELGTPLNVISGSAE